MLRVSEFAHFYTAFALGMVTPWGGAVAPLQEWRGRTGYARDALQYSPTRRARRGALIDRFLDLRLIKVDASRYTKTG